MPACAAEKAPAKPGLNVLFIISDDLNCALGCYGNTVVQTPNIDRLARRGVRFERAYSNYPVCNPSRASFLSGLYPETTKVLNNTTSPRAHLGKDFVFMPEHFRAHGYFTGGIGKITHGIFADTIQWDVFAEPAHGIDLDDVPDAPRDRRRRLGQAQRPGQQALPEHNVPFPWQATDTNDEDEPDGQVALQTVKLLERNKDKPFFITAGFHKPHIPHVAPKKYFDMYPPEKIPLPKEPAGHSKDIPAMARGKYYPDLTELQQRQIISHYYAATTFMDAQVGKVLDAMDRLKLWDNTIVVFLGDHGWHLGEHGGFWAKASLMQESAAAPLIVAAPGMKANAASPRMVEFVDVYPTLTELCQLPVPARVEGLSFAPLLDDPKRLWKKTIYTVVTRRNDLGRAVRTEQYTYIEWPDGSAQLYDYTRDPKEYVNLAREPKHAKTLGEMKELLRRGARVNLPMTAK
jgi:iduronate 2-sulfatase